MNQANPQLNNQSAESKKQNYAGRWLAFGLPLGVGIGTAMGAATQNMAVWVAFGAAIGICFGLLVSQFKST
jgi:hypothetical protein